MELVTGLFILIASSSVFMNEAAKDQCKGDIADIYYPPSKANVAYHDHCPYTKTMVSEEMPMRYILRNHYEAFTKDDTYRYPIRTDMDRLYPAKKLNK